MNLYSAKEMTDLLERHDFFFKKNLGQNFLINETIARRIASCAFDTLSGTKPSLVLEIGPGAGALTLQLSRLFDKVLALEIDPHLMGVLEESLANQTNVKVHNTDALTFDYTSLKTAFPDYEIALCSNLPYYLTSEVIMRLLESGLPLSSVTVLIQKEACARLTAKPGSGDYGAITASVSYYASARRLFSVGPGNFIPRPKVDSSVLQLIPYQTPPLSVKDESLFFSVIRAAFSARRKTLLNALCSSGVFPLSKDEVEALVREAGIDPARRGETLTPEEFGTIADKFFERKVEK